MLVELLWSFLILTTLYGLFSVLISLIRFRLSEQQLGMLCTPGVSGRKSRNNTPVVSTSTPTTQTPFISNAPAARPFNVAQDRSLHLKAASTLPELKRPSNG